MCHSAAYAIYTVGQVVPPGGCAVRSNDTATWDLRCDEVGAAVVGAHEVQHLTVWRSEGTLAIAYG